MEKTPVAIKIWLAGMVPLWIAAKIHALMTWNSGHYVAAHWPFWAAMVVWSLLLAVMAKIQESRQARL